MKEDQEGLNLDARDLLCGTLFSLLRLGRLKKIWQNDGLHLDCIRININQIKIN